MYCRIILPTPDYHACLRYVSHAVQKQTTTMFFEWCYTVPSCLRYLCHIVLTQTMTAYFIMLPTMNPLAWHIYSGSRDTNDNSWFWVFKLHCTTTLEVSFSGSSNPNYRFLIVMCFNTGQQIVSEEELLIQLAIQQSLADSEMSSRRPQESWAQETALSNSEEDLQR